MTPTDNNSKDKTVTDNKTNQKRFAIFPTGNTRNTMSDNVSRLLRSQVFASGVNWELTLHNVTKINTKSLQFSFNKSFLDEGRQPLESLLRARDKEREIKRG